MLTAAAGRGLRPGADFSIVGYNDIPLAAHLPTPLTSVRTPFEQIATAAVELLAEPAPPAGSARTALPTLIPRASTAPPR